MLINWRDDEYEFSPRNIYGGKDRPSRNSNVDAPIFGLDTESVELDERYEMQCFTFSDPKEDHIVYVGEKGNGLYQLMVWFLRNYGEWMMEERHCFFFLHNLAYDFPQLAKTDKRLVEMIKIGVGLSEELHLFDISRCKVYMDKDGLFTGSAPHFTLIVKMGKQSFRIYFRDTFSYFPGSLDRMAKDLKMKVQKQKRQDDLGQRDYRKEGQSEAKTEFEDYAKIDARVTRIGGETIRQLHKDAKMQKIRPSAPGFAIASLFQVLDDDDFLVTGSWKDEDMQLVFDTYRGGRTGGVYHGRVTNISVLDFHSSYPASMTSLPTFRHTTAYVRIDDLSLDNVFSILSETGNAFLRVSGIESDEKYPSIINTVDGKLTPVYGRFKNVATTGVELMVGYLSGTLRIDEVHEMLVVVDMEDGKTNPFKVFAEDGYEAKANAEKGSLTYLAEKIKLNSAYGKLIESRHQRMLGADDFNVYLPFLPEIEKDFGNYYYNEYITAVEDNKGLTDIYDRLLDELVDTFDEETRKNFLIKMFGDFSISGRIYGKHVIPAAASLITATSRARLCAAMKSLSALYWDTDSIFISSDWTNDPEALSVALERGSSYLTPGVLPLTMGEALGELDCEIQNASGFLAGTKRYYLEGTDDKGEFVLKVAIHGIPAMPIGKPNEDDDDKTKKLVTNMYRKVVIEMLSRGFNYDYESKPRPLKSKEAESAEVIGLFRTKRYESRFHLDERLSWKREDEGWIGTVQEYHTLIQRKKRRTKNEQAQTRKFVSKHGRKD